RRDASAPNCDKAAVSCLSEFIPVPDTVTRSSASDGVLLSDIPYLGYGRARWRGRGRSGGYGGSGAVKGTFVRFQRATGRRSVSPCISLSTARSTIRRNHWAFGGASVLEVVEDYDRGTYRAVYTVRFSEAVYVLHVFQKKAKHGIATSKRDLNLIRTRPEEAKRLHAEKEGALPMGTTRRRIKVTEGSGNIFADVG